jgi:heme exporter protein C
MLRPLLVMALAFFLYFVTVLLIRLRTALVERKVRALRLAEAERGAAPSMAAPA